MGQASRSDARTVLDRARLAEERTRAAGDWYPTFLWVVGATSVAWIVVLEVLFHGGSARWYASAGLAAFVGLVAWWGESHDAYPRGANRRLTVATVTWFVAYVWILGPLVRWQAGTSLGWWSLAAAVFATPFFVSAWVEGRRR